MNAYQHAENNGTLDTATDDSALVEALKIPVRIVESTKSNIKITTPEDILLAKAILKDRG